MSQLGDALFTTTQKKVLGLLYGQPEKSFYTKEIIRLTGMGVATIKRELDRMLASGILSLTKIGNQHHYQANPDCPIYFELLAIVKKTFGIADEIKHALISLDDKIDIAFIYGSISKGSDTASSDVDLMLVGHELIYGDIMALLFPVEETLQRSVNPTIYNKTDFVNKVKKNNSFITRVMEQPKIMIKGIIDDIGKPGKNTPGKKRTRR